MGILFIRRLTVTLEELWQQKSDRELEVAARELAEYTEEAEQIIRAEIRRRGMLEPPTFIRNAHGLPVANQETEDYIREQVRAIHRGRCPRCSGHGPVDVHTSHWVWSAVFFTRWGSCSHICCRKCGRIEQVKAGLSSFVLGWWGFPWGLLMTPIQIIQNLVGLLSGPSDSTPSENLYLAVYKQLQQDSATS
jgi:hypothetical protein